MEESINTVDRPKKTKKATATTKIVSLKILNPF